MKPQLCNRCKQHMAVVFITKIENGRTSNEGLCIKCAREIGLKPVDEILRRMNIPEEDIDSISDEMMNAFSPDGMFDYEEGEEEEIMGQTPTFPSPAFPFMDRLFSKGGFDLPPAPQQQQPQSDTRTKRAEAKPKNKYLDNYCLSLSQRAREGKLDAVIGREREIDRVLQIINRRQKNNPCLIGEPGVGKTAIAEGLAQRIADGDAPRKLLDKEVYLLDMTAVVAGTQFRGQFESRMKGLIDEVKRLGNIILVIDEVHTIIGAGDAEGSMNAANIMKPALSRGEIQVIGATTYNEYRKYIEKDAALERRFQPVKVGEPSIEDSIAVLRGVSRYYEQFHGVRIPDDVVASAVHMSERYITDRFLPDKAIDLIDEACSRLNLDTPELSESEDIKQRLESLRGEYAKLAEIPYGNEIFARLATVKETEMKLENRFAELQSRRAPELTREHLAAVVEQWTGIPSANIRERELDKLSNLERSLKERVVGQDEAIELVAAAVRRGRVGLSPVPKPVSFIFVGPTGVGKTELVKCLAKELFDAPDALIRLDMSEYMEKHAVSRLVGSPPGYVGYDEAGQLTEKVRRRPYSVVLFDEIEKAHPDALNILLQILDDGHISDSQGRKVNFEHTVIIMTSNAGSHSNAGVAGFAGAEHKQSGERANKALREIMRPEFINRVDEIVTFKPLEPEHFERIARIMTEDLRVSMGKNGVRLEFDDELTRLLAQKAYSAKYGARNLRRVIQKEVEDKIAALIIDVRGAALAGVHAGAENGAVTITAVGADLQGERI